MSGVQALGNGRHMRYLERSGRHDDVVGFVGAVVELDEVAAPAAAHGADGAVELDRQVEVAGVIAEVGDHVVAARVGVGVAGERAPRQAVVAHGREQLQRVPPRAPCRRGRVGGFEDRELPPLAGEQIADRQAGLAAAHDDDVMVLDHGVTLKENIMPLS